MEPVVAPPTAQQTGEIYQTASGLPGSEPGLNFPASSVRRRETFGPEVEGHVGSVTSGAAYESQPFFVRGPGHPAGRFRPDFISSSL